MSENSSFLPEENQRSVPPVIYAVVSNGLQIYGILALGWHFFPILYLVVGRIGADHFWIA
jgi:hypothetical protein